MNFCYKNYNNERIKPMGYVSNIHFDVRMKIILVICSDGYLIYI